MKKLAAGLAIALCSVAAAAAVDIDYCVSAGAGAAMAAGGDLSSAVKEFGDTVGAAAGYAPVLGASLGVGLDMGIYGPFRLNAGLEARRLGYAFWAPTAGASSWLALWTAALRLGARYEPSPWFVGLGGIASAPISGISNASTQAGASVILSYDVDSARAFIPGAYLEGGLELGSGFAAGTLIIRPSLGLEAELFSGGLVDGVETWQAALTLVVSAKLGKKASR